jgi:hypothetical protein
MSCQNKIKQICLATVNMADTNQGKLPTQGNGSGFGGSSFGYYPDPVGGPNTPYNANGDLWFFILPFMEQNNLYLSTLSGPAPLPQCNADTPIVPQYTLWSQPMWSGKTGSLNYYVCPSDYTTNGWAGVAISYAYNEAVMRAGKNVQMYPGSITDGTSNTIFFSEQIFYCWKTVGGTTTSDWNELREGDHGFFNSIDGGTPVGAASYPQFSPTIGLNGTCTPKLPNAFHGPVINVSMGDGSVRVVSQGVGTTTWSAAVSPQGGDILGSDW